MIVGRLAEIRRYPVKSMGGELRAAAEVGLSGLVGDRRYAVVDVETGKVASAKDPRRWAGLLDLHAEYVGDPARGRPVRLTFPDGRALLCDDRAVDRRRTIRGTDWQLLDLQTKYQGYFSSYLQRRIEQ